MSRRSLLPRNLTHPRMPLELRLEMRTDRSGGPEACWMWQGAANDHGYGKMQNRGIVQVVHRFAYQLAYGPIPANHEIDHVCHSRDVSCEAANECPHRRCVNPRHLEAVTPAENVRRGRTSTGLPGGGKHSRGKTHCPQGHPYDATNTKRYRNGRYCFICSRQYCRNSYRKRQQERIKSDAATTV